MTRAMVLRGPDGRLVGLDTEGHAGAGDAGRDLVCSAISALTQTAVNALEEIAQVRVDAKIAPGMLSFRLPEQLEPAQRDTADIILRTITRGLTDIAIAYPAHLTLTIIDWRESP